MMSINGSEGSGKGLHIKALIPIGIQGLPDYTEWVRETEDFTIG